jgi:DNA-binding CsgD family transcriptional regulator
MPVDALAFSQNAHRIHPTFATLLESSMALAADRRFGDAKTILTDAEEHCDGPRDAIALVRWLTRLTRLSSGTAQDFVIVALRVSDFFPDDCNVQGERELIEVTRATLSMDWAVAARLGEKLARDESLDRGTRIRAACASGTAHAQQGRALYGLSLIKLASALNALPPGLHDSRATASVLAVSDDESASHGQALEIFFADAMIRCMTGSDVDSLAPELDSWIERSVAQQAWGNLGFLNLIGGRLARFRGDDVLAQAELIMAEANFERVDSDGQGPWVHCLLARTLVRLDRPAEAELRLARANKAMIADRSDVLFRFEAGRTAVGVSFAQGKVDEARTLLTGLLSTAPTIGAHDMLHVLDERIMLGEPLDALVSDYENATRRTDSPVLTASGMKVQAIIGRNAAALHLIASTFSKMGAFGAASEAALESENIFRDAGDLEAAARSQRESLAYEFEARGQAAENGSEVTVSIPALKLTPREKEVIALALTGLSNREVAAALFLSVRTVESHLYRANQKQVSPGQL